MSDSAPPAHEQRTRSASETRRGRAGAEFKAGKHNGAVAVRQRELSLP